MSLSKYTTTITIIVITVLTNLLYAYTNRSDMYEKRKHSCRRRKHTWRKSYTSRSAPYLSDLYLANTLYYIPTGQTARGGEGTHTANGRTEVQGVGGGDSLSPQTSSVVFHHTCTVCGVCRWLLLCPHTHSWQERNSPDL